MKLYYRKPKKENTPHRGSFIQPLEKQYVSNEQNDSLSLGDSTFSQNNPNKSPLKKISLEEKYKDFPYKNIVQPKNVFNYNMADIMIHNKTNCASCGK